MHWNVITYTGVLCEVPYLRASITYTQFIHYCVVSISRDNHITGGAISRLTIKTAPPRIQKKVQSQQTDFMINQTSSFIRLTTSHFLEF